MPREQRRLAARAAAAVSLLIMTGSWGCGGGAGHLLSPAPPSAGTSQGVDPNDPIGNEPGGLAVNPLTSAVYVASLSADRLSVVDGTNNTLVATVHDGDGPIRAAIDTATNTLFVTDLRSDKVTVIDGTAKTTIARARVGHLPRGVAVNTRTKKVYVANYGDDTVSVIDATTYTVMATVKVGALPRVVAVNA